MTTLASAAMRTLGSNDFADVQNLVRLAGWNQTPEDWRMLLDLAPDGCFGIEMDGRIVATTTLVNYGTQIAWLGMVLTHPDFRRQGLARQLIARAIDYAARLEIRTIKLDATDEGRRMYESFGFRAEQPIERWLRPGAQVNLVTPVSAPLPFEIEPLDFAACGYHRSNLARALAVRSQIFTERDAFLFCRPGRLNVYLGPCVSENPQSARRLVSQVIESSPAGWFWDLLFRNSEAVTIARNLGFNPQRHLTRMVLGENVRAKEEWIYAIAGFELG